MFISLVIVVVRSVCVRYVVLSFVRLFRYFIISSVRYLVMFVCLYCGRSCVLQFFLYLGISFGISLCAFR